MVFYLGVSLDYLLAGLVLGLGPQKESSNIFYDTVLTIEFYPLRPTVAGACLYKLSI